MLLIFIAIVIANKLGFHPMNRANLFFLPAVLFSIFFVFVANLGNFSFQRALPFIGNGITPTLLSGLSNLFAFGGISYLYFLPPYLKEYKGYSKIALASIGISALFLLLSVTTVLLLFPIAASSEEVIPLYLASRYIEFGRFFQRLDAIFVFVWIISIISYLSITSYFATSIFQKIANLQYNKWTIGIFCTLAFGLSLLPKNLQQLSMLENNVYQYIILILVFGISLGILIFSNIKYLIQQKKKGLVILEENASVDKGG